MAGIQTEFEFVLPRGYLDEAGTLHRRGTMRLATARDELQPLRDPTVTSPDDPRLTILILARVVKTLGTMTLVTPHEIEGLFAADLAYLQDFYGVVNFGTEDEIAAMLAAQSEADRAVTSGPANEPPAPSTPGAPDEAERTGRRRGVVEEVPTSSR